MATSPSPAHLDAAPPATHSLATSAPPASPKPSSAGSPVPPSPAAPSASPSPRKRRKVDSDSLRYVLTSGFAGGIAGCIAKTSVAPLDRVKILFQTRSPDYQRYAGTWLGVFRASRDIYAETGFRGLLQGHSATLLRIFPYAAIKFMAYEGFHSILMPTPESETSSRRFLAGSLAGITTTALTYPLELIRVRLAFEPHHSKSDQASLLRTIRMIYLSPPPETLRPSQSPAPTSNGKTRPIAAPPPPPEPPSLAPPTNKPSLTHFYRGVFPTLAGIIPYAGTSFLVWGYLKSDLFPSILPPSVRSRHRAALDLLAGGIAGAIGQTTAYPLDIVRRRMQVGPVLHAGMRGRQGFVETAKNVYRAHGWRGFFVGLSIGYLKVVPMNAVSFATWVGMKRVLGLQEKRERGEKETVPVVRDTAEVG
ncbi:SPOSA6832_04811 [Sporobolomyces salmonicolor]|uniref:SPOSA6832_04811-mRNA-1:cds n=1 Tax=Sporidiobolus salmonicolor TaxID=5005 RepID=A0A0D6ET26_SPOSA|nr:SPOSA6832_04811 [Sporobolomyces salmonicolor]